MAAKSKTSLKLDKLPTMPTARTFCHAFRVGDVAFVAGGCDVAGKALGAFESLDISKKKPKWNRLTDMPTRRAGVTGGVIQDKVIVISGVDETKKSHEVVECYDVGAKSWSKLDPISEPMQGVATFVRDSRLHALGGMKENGNPSDAFHALDLERNKWAMHAPLNSARYAASAFVVDDCVYAMGGRVGKLPSVACEMFDFREKRWQSLTDAPSKRVFVASAVDPASQRIFIVGGLSHPSDDGFCNTLEAYDIRAAKWESLAPLPQKKGDMVCRFLDNRLWVFGGMGSDSMEVLPQLYSECHAYEPTSDSWSESFRLSSPRSAMAAIAFPTGGEDAGDALQEKLFIVGGLLNGGPANSAELVTSSKGR